MNNTIEVCVKVKQNQLLPLMAKLGVEEWSFKKGKVDVDLTMVNLFDSAVNDLNNGGSDSAF